MNDIEAFVIAFDRLTDEQREQVIREIQKPRNTDDPLAHDEAYTVVARDCIELAQRKGTLALVDLLAYFGVRTLRNVPRERFVDLRAMCAEHMNNLPDLPRSGPDTPH